MKFRLINGRVFDPTQNLNNVKKDIYVEDGLIVDPKKNEKKEFKKTFDVSDMVVMAGAIDIHSHIAGGNVNTARMLMPEIHKKFTEKMLNNRKHLPSRGSRWTSDGTGFRYAEMGFTTVIEPAVLPINSLVSHLELENIPLIDKAGLAILGNDGFLLNAIRNKKSQSYINDYVAWTLNSTKCLGIKVINAGGSESYKRGITKFGLDDVVPNYGISSRKILEKLNKACEQLGIPHPLHVHCNNLGMAGNVDTAINTIESAEGRKMHLAHIQFYGYDNKGEKGFSSGALKLSEAVNKNNNISIDIGQVMFKPTVTISSDILRQFDARSHSNPKKWVMNLAEDGGGGIVPYKYNSKNFINTLQWIIGLELFLLVNDPWRVFLTTDHPNGAPFTMYPKLFRLLMDFDYRMSELERTHPDARRYSNLHQIKRCYNLYDISTMTRAAPAKILGLKKYGSLKPGSVADISVYKYSNNFEKMFSSAYLVFKNGINIVKKGKITSYKKGKTHYLNLDYRKSICKDIQNWFDKEYAFDIDNLNVSEYFFTEDNFNKNFSNGI